MESESDSEMDSQMQMRVAGGLTMGHETAGGSNLLGGTGRPDCMIESQQPKAHESKRLGYPRPNLSVKKEL